MSFWSTSFINEAERKKGIQWVLQHFGRDCISPGFTVADYVMIGEFYKNVSECRPNEELAPIRIKCEHLSDKTKER
ncbi:MAG: hypothetical protein WCK03_04040 [Candidatus Taylorbacteria bacterium]